MTKKYHITTNIAGLLRNCKNKKINFIEDGKGNFLSDTEVRIELANLQAKGYKLIPVDECEGFDPFGGGCPGHEVDKL